MNEENPRLRKYYIASEAEIETVSHHHGTLRSLLDEPAQGVGFLGGMGFVLSVRRFGGEQSV